MPASAMVADAAEHGLHHGRRQAHRWLVEQDDLRLSHQSPPEGEHLLLAATEEAGCAGPPIFNTGNILKTMSSDSGRACPAGGERAHAQVLLHGQRAEDLAALGNEDHAGLDDLVGVRAGDVVPLQRDRAGFGLMRSGSSTQRRRLAGTVRAENEGDPALRR